MDASSLKRKLSSRKLWTAIVGVITGLAMAFGLDQNTISTVAGAVMAASSVIVYIASEAKVDAAAVSKALEAVEAAQKAADAIKKEDHQNK